MARLGSAWQAWPITNDIDKEHTAMSNDNDGIALGDMERGPSAKFPELKTSYTGTVIDPLKRVPQTDFDSGEVLRWNDGSERMQTIIGLQLDDGTTTTLYARGGKFDAHEGTGTSMEGAIVAAVRRAGADRIRKGGRLTVTHTGLSKPAKKGLNPAKLFEATYEPPEESLGVAGLFSDAEA
jgi:hypothetical protein